MSAGGGGAAPLGRIASLRQQTIEECQARMRRCQLPKLVDIRTRGLEVVRLESGFGLRDQINYFLRVFRRVYNGGRCRTRRLTL
jgi:hypothetical protein